MTATPQPTVYYARSDRNPAIFYLVAAVDNRCRCGDKSRGLWHCGCPDHIYRARDCKHVKRVQAGALAPAKRQAVAA
jgi:hypothetical protein